MAERAPDQRAALAATMLAGVLLLGGAAAAAGLALAALLLATPWHAWAGPCAATGLASAAFLIWEFFISYAYLRRREGEALRVNAATLGALLAALGGAAAAGIAPSAAEALTAYALSAGLGGLVGWRRSGLPLRVARAQLRRELATCWRGGRWALGGTAVTWLQTQSYAYVLGAVLGPAAAGMANLARLFVSPFSFLVPAINKLAFPRLAEMHRSAPARLAAAGRTLAAALALAVLAYAGLLALGFDAAAPIVLGRPVSGLGTLVALWCAVQLFNVVRTAGSLVLQARRGFRALTLLNLPSGALSLILALLLAPPLGAPGAVLAALGGEALLAFLIWRRIHA
jgi:O-antigen/teichoic acid export membrane protein